MAQKVNVLLVDDIDGSNADETIRFGLDGAHYEIDLNSDHAGELREKLKRYVRAARKVTGSAADRAPRIHRSSSHGAANKEVRN